MASKNTSNNTLPSNKDQYQDPKEVEGQLPKDQDQDPEPTSKKRKLDIEEGFDRTKKVRENALSLNDALAEYVLSQMNCHISDSYIKEEILKEFPVPENIVKKKEFHSSIKLFSKKKELMRRFPLTKRFLPFRKRLVT